MPEQYEGIREILNDLNKVPKPIVTEDMKEQLQIWFVQSLQNKEEILISYYHNRMVHDMYINVLHIKLFTSLKLFFSYLPIILK
ncbi:3-oxoacyl-ACP synthase [Bacillus cereus]|uniref:3-oxoacyl-ACP synthase n=1 Tax=Bacillus cereus TaxID=1396 RepID=A0A2C1F669_BACCE|nr:MULTISPECIES: YolD-like family protein [Bacillus cereus group]MDR4984579.1 YolD-like family protein [Bacillus cereus]MEA1011008.1 YolD-like family protein [Bacillus cereus]PES98077.1 3-oxoacyl-ACP synthase [Bacillus cereus]PFP83528.1 3-oxoacyl-ACP synthase [Bacillus cereus]PGT20446.1 3-oxoacyl-ACP synthase [Bacillus cereus]